MNHHRAYQQMSTPPMPRVDVIIALFRKTLDRLDRAAALVRDGNEDAARPLLADVQLIVTSLSTGSAGDTDASAVRFLRIYEFVSHQVTVGAIENIEAARRVLTPLLEAFEAIREHAIRLEQQGVLPPLDRESLVSVSA